MQYELKESVGNFCRVVVGNLSRLRLLKTENKNTYSRVQSLGCKSLLTDGGI